MNHALEIHNGLLETVWDLYLRKDPITLAIFNHGYMTKTPLELSHHVK